MRFLVIGGSILIIWLCFGIAVPAWLQSEQDRCSKFADLYAECVAPQWSVALLLSVVLVIASTILGHLGLAGRPRAAVPPIGEASE